MLWAGSIAFGLAIYHTVFAREFAPRSYLRPAGALVMGCVIGFLGSVLVVLTIVSVYRIDSTAAFDLLKWRSQETNVKLHVLAEQLLTDVRGLGPDDEFATYRAKFDGLLLTVHRRVKTTAE